MNNVDFIQSRVRLLVKAGLLEDAIKLLEQAVGNTENMESLYLNEILVILGSLSRISRCERTQSSSFEEIQRFYNNISLQTLSLLDKVCAFLRMDNSIVFHASESPALAFQE